MQKEKSLIPLVGREKVVHVEGGTQRRQHRDVDHLPSSLRGRKKKGSSGARIILSRNERRKQHQTRKEDLTMEEKIEWGCIYTLLLRKEKGPPERDILYIKGAKYFTSIMDNQKTHRGVCISP